MTIARAKLNPLAAYLPDRTCWIVLAVALVVRVVYLGLYITEIPYANFPINDAEIAWDRAGAILQHGPLLSETGPYYQPPLYSYLLAPIRLLVGDRPLAAAVVQQVVGLLNVYLVWVIAVSVFECRFAWIPALAFGLSWPVLAYETKLVGVTFCTTSILVLLVLLLNKRNVQDWRWDAGIGVVMALSVLLRPNLLLLIPLLLLWMWGAGKKTDTIYRDLAIVVLGFGCTILPVTVRNYWIGGDFVPICANGGVTFYMGNNSHAAGGLGQAPDIPTNIRGQMENDRLRASELAGRDLSPSQASDFWYDKAWNWMKNRPHAALVLFVKKAVLFVSGRAGGVSYEIQDESALLCHHPAGYVFLGLNALFGLTFAAGWTALLTIRWWREPVPMLLVLPVFAAFGISVLFYAAMRFIVPILPCMALLGYWRTYAWYQSLEKKRMIAGHFVLVFAISAIAITLIPQSAIESFLAWRQPHYRPETVEAITAYNIGVCYQRLDRPQDAEQYYRRALELDPRHVSAAKNLSALLGEQSRFAEAEKILVDALHENPGDPSLLVNLATTYARMDQTHRALEIIRQILDVDSERSDALRLQQFLLQGRRIEPESSP